MYRPSSSLLRWVSVNVARSPLQCMWVHLDGDNSTSERHSMEGGDCIYSNVNWRYQVDEGLKVSQCSNTSLPTISVPLHLRLVAVESWVDNYCAAQTHGLPLSSKRHSKRINDVNLERDAILGNWADWRQRRQLVIGNCCAWHLDIFSCCLLYLIWQ